MIDELDVQRQQDISLKKALKKIDSAILSVDYGSVKIQIRDNRPVLIVIERTVKLD